jgi:hypothetical protein
VPALCARRAPRHRGGAPVTQKKRPHRAGVLSSTCRGDVAAPTSAWL